MDYFDKMEQKNKEVMEEKKFQELYEKQAKIARFVLLIVMGSLGFFFIVFGIIALCIENPLEPELLPLGIVFTSLGGFFLVLGLLLFFVIPKKGNYERYKKRVNRLGGLNFFDMNLRIEFLEDRVKKLEEENDTLKRRIESVERKL